MKTLSNADKSHFERVPGRRLAIQTVQKNSDITVFFVHGLGGNKAQWRFQWEYLSRENVNLVAWDAIGHGQSHRPRAPQAYNSAYAALDLDAIVKAYPTKHRIIIAHSYGCRVTLQWMSQLLSLGKPVPVDSVILLGPAPLTSGFQGPLFNNWMKHLPLTLLSLAIPVLHKGFEKMAWNAEVSPKLLKHERKAAYRNSLRVVDATRRGAATFPLDVLARYDGRVSILAGADDGIVPLSITKHAHDFFPKSSFYILDKCGHQIMLEKPDRVNSAVAEELLYLRALVQTNQ